MRIEQLEYLLMISKCASLTEASERLFITQQSLGKAIRDLENELGVQLLVRNNRGCTLTKEGYEALQQAKEILDKIHQPDKIAVPHDFSLAFHIVQQRRYCLGIQSGLVSDPPHDRFKDSEIVRLRAGEKIDVKQLALCAQFLDIRVSPE